MEDLYALVDCNNFYASCERVFDPTARKTPVIVLSNNDGCVVARSQEAKDIGIKMGQPFFECQNLVRMHNVRVFSSNYILYGDMSARVMSVLADFSPNIEFYSIDEAFLLLKGFENYNLEEYGRTICERVKQYTGIPVSVGIAKTKTLAKVANHLAKKVYKSGVFCLSDNADEHLKNFPVNEVWGIGHQRTKWLLSQGIQTAFDLKQTPDKVIKDKMTVTGLRTVMELRGIPCLSLEEITPDKKAVTCSRTFGFEVTKLEELEEAVCAYIARASEKMREQQSLAGYLQVIVETNRFKGDYYNNSLGMYVSPPSAYTPLLCGYGKRILKQIFREGYRYKKAGVILTNFTSEDVSQQYFWEPVYENSRQERLMQVIDKYNTLSYHSRIQLAAEGISQPWHMKQNKRSRRFTTDWDELLQVS